MEGALCKKNVPLKNIWSERLLKKRIDRDQTRAVISHHPQKKLGKH
jgi:hypothetical protein